MSTRRLGVAFGALALLAAWPLASTFAHDPPRKARDCRCAPTLASNGAGRFEVVSHQDGDVELLDTATGVLYVTRGRETVEAIDPVQAVVLTRALERRDHRNGRVIVAPSGR
jgi:hypothetical protein